jgi:hypothetical protein
LLDRTAHHADVIAIEGDSYRRRGAETDGHYGVAEAGRVNGVMARYEGFARAGGPLASALLYDHAGAISVFGGLSVAFLVMAPMAWLLLERNQPSSRELRRGGEDGVRRHDEALPHRRWGDTK